MEATGISKSTMDKMGRGEQVYLYKGETIGTDEAKKRGKEIFVNFYGQPSFRCFK